MTGLGRLDRENGHTLTPWMPSGAATSARARIVGTTSTWWSGSLIRAGTIRPRQCKYQRNPNLFLIHGLSMAGATVLAKRLAVIGRQDEQEIAEAKRLQPLAKHSDCRVERRERRVVRATRRVCPHAERWVSVDRVNVGKGAFAPMASEPLEGSIMNVRGRTLAAGRWRRAIEPGDRRGDIKSAIEIGQGARKRIRRELRGAIARVGEHRLQRGHRLGELVGIEARPEPVGVGIQRRQQRRNRRLGPRRRRVCPFEHRRLLAQRVDHRRPSRFGSVESEGVRAQRIRDINDDVRLVRLGVGREREGSGPRHGGGRGGVCLHDDR